MIKKWLTVIGKTILLLIGITFLSFLLVYHSPGDPAMVALKKSGMRVSEKALELKREELGLNDPFAVQYGRWLNEFFHGDLGESYKTGKAVAGELKKTIPATLLLTVAALALTILISFPIGVLCAKYKDRGFDNMIRFVTYFLSSLPSFFLALLMMYVLSMKLQLLPVIGSVSAKRNYYAGSCPGADTVCLVYPPDSRHCASGAGTGVCRWFKVKRSFGEPDSLFPRAEKLYASDCYVAWHVIWNSAWRFCHCGNYFFLAGSRKTCCDIHQRAGLSGDSGLCCLDGNDLPADKCCSRVFVSDSGSKSQKGKECTMKKMDGKFKISLLFLAVILIIPVIGPHLIRHDPYAVNVRNAFLSPCKEYLFGTDNLGRCVFCRILAGSRTSIYTALLIVGIVFLVGTLVGILAGFAGGVLDEILMKITLVFQAFPAFVLSIAIAGILGVGLWNGVLALSAVYWTTYARLSRSLVVSMKQENYIYAARMNGVPLYRMITAYILPNMMGSLIVTAAMDIGSVILSMAGLSFLGLGAARPTAEWGAVMSEARDYLQKAPWIIVFNGLALFLVVTVFQLFGDRLSEFVHKKEARTEN